MSGLDKIIARLERDCADECDNIEMHAQADAAALLENAARESRTEADRILSDARRQAELIAKKAESAALANDRRMLLEARVALIDETVAAAVKKLRALDASSYFGVLERLAAKYRTGAPGTLYLSEADLARKPAGFLSAFPEITVAETPGTLADGFLLKYGDIEINCSFDAMRSAALDDLKAIAAENLFAPRAANENNKG